jgi:ABC-type cobalamin/Fe3+-siderophores transport system ATPase subunit
MNASSVTPFTIERLTNLRNINALPPAQDLTFGSQLTIIYGPNGSGKTGYMRPLGCAGFARGDREVLSDARKVATNQTPAADIEVVKNGKKATVSWKYGTRPSDLSGVYVFDGTSASVHLTKANALSFSPAGLDLLTALATATDQVRERLRRMIEAKSTPHSFEAYFAGDSVIRREIVALGAKTDVARLRQMATLTTLETDSMDDLDRQIAVLKTQNVPTRIAILRQEAQDIQRLVELLGNADTALNPAVEQQVTDLISLPAVTIRDLLRATLRHRPDRIILGEVRGGEAFDLLQALNTGHSGTISTIHANSAQQAIARLTSCVLQAGVELPYTAIRANIGDAIQLLLHIERRQGKRHVSELIRIERYDPIQDRYEFVPLYQRA